MENSFLKDLINRAEDSTIQLKRDVTNSTKLGSEFVAFSNAKGGYIIIGVDDDKSIYGLSDADISRINQLISNTSEQNVKPPISPFTRVFSLEGKKILLVEIDEGINKPYATNEGIYWTKKASDKRKLSQVELQRLFQSTERMYADEQLLKNTSLEEVDLILFSEYYEKEFGESFHESGLEIDQLFQNLKLGEKKHLNLAGLLLFGKKPQYFKPAFMIKAISFFGNDPEETLFRDSEDIKGSLSKMYQDGLAFIMRSIHKVQNNKGFNSLGDPEVPKLVFEEILVNALIHRDYYINAPITIFVFDNRIEITSPGKLPNNLSVENIRSGVSIIRNPILTSFGSRLLPYRGVGTGIRRTIKHYKNIDFINDDESERFQVVIERIAKVK